MKLITSFLQKDKRQEIYLIQSKLEVHDTFEQDEKITTKYEAVNDEDVINKEYLDPKLSKKEGQTFYIQKDYNEYKLNNNNHSVENLLNERAVRTTLQYF